MPRLSPASRIHLFLCALLVLSAGAGAAFVTERYRRSLTERELSYLELRARAAAVRLESKIEALIGDTLVLARAPMVPLLREAFIDPRVLPAGPGPLADTLVRSEVAFKLFLETHPSYTRARYLSLADSGREIVRVNRVGESIVAVPFTELGQLADAPYFQQAAQSPPGAVYLSEISIDQEQTDLDRPTGLVVRAASPIADADGRLMGMVVFDKRLEPLFHDLETGLGADRALYICDDGGDFLHRPDARQGQRCERGAPRQWRDEFIETLDDPDSQVNVLRAGVLTTVRGERVAMGACRVDIDPSQRTRAVTLVVTAPYEAIIQDSVAVRDRVATVGAGLLLLLFVPGFYFVQRYINAHDRRREQLEAAMAVRRRAEAALRQSEAVHRSIMAACVDPLIAIDERGVIKFCSDSVQQVFGYRVEELIGESINVLMPEPHRSQHDQYLDRFVRTGEAHILSTAREVEGCHKDGTIIPCELSVAAADVPDHDHAMFTGIMRDIRARKQAENQLREHAIQIELKNLELKRTQDELTTLVGELTRSNRELDDFAYIASHDLKEPLRGIHNYARFVQQDYGDKLDDTGRSRLQTLTRLSQRMESLIDSLLCFSRVGRVDLAREEVDLNEVVAEVLDTLGPFLAERGCRVRMSGKLPTLPCDRVHAGEVFRNLITNAAKYNDKADKWVEIGVVGPEPAVDATSAPAAAACTAAALAAVDAPAGVAAATTALAVPAEFCGRGAVAAPVVAADGGCGRATVFYVRDNGIGIPERHFDSIFRIFKRLHARDAYGGGTGAGLTIVKKIVERHGGRIWVTSRPGEGTTFHFTLATEPTLQADR